MKIKREYKEIALGILAVAAVLAVLNSGYFLTLVKTSFWRVETPAELTNYQPPPTMEPNRLIIPSLGIEVPIVYSVEVSEKAFQEALKGGVAHYPGTAIVGQSGNAYIFGHSSDYIWAKGNYKTIFANLPKIALGAEIIASDPLGNKFVYQVVRSFATSAKDTSVLAQGDKSERLLTLQTSYPIGTAARRWIVVGEIKTIPDADATLP